MNKEQLDKKLKSLAGLLEILLTIILILGIGVGIIHMVKYIFYIIEADVSFSYNIMKEFLSYTLLLVVGVEFVLMLTTHSIDYLLEIVLFLIARMMLIYGDSMLSLLFGALAVAIVYLVIKNPQLRKREGEKTANNE